MSDTESSAGHLLGIYQMRLKIAEERKKNLKPEVIAGMRQLIAGLSALPSDAKVRLEIQGDKTRFRTASTGDLLVEFDFKDDA